MFCFFSISILFIWGFSGLLDGKEFACRAGDPGSIPGSGRSPREGNGYLSTPVFLPGKFHRQRSLAQVVDIKSFLGLKKLFIYLFIWPNWFLVGAHRLFVASCRIFGCSAQAVCPAACGRLVPGSGVEPVSPAFQGGCLTIAPPGKSPQIILVDWFT